MDHFADLVLTPIALFSGRPLAVSVALTLMFSALALWAFVLRAAETRFLRPLRRAARQIAPLAAEPDPQARKNAAQKIFDAEPALKEAWRRFSATLDVADGQLQNFSDPIDFFGLPHLTGHSYPKWSSTLAGVFLTIGLFFTFVGLSAALLQLGGNGHDALSPGELKNAVQGILAVSSAKFITSIAGILCYIFWSLVARAQGAAQTRAEDALIASLRDITTYVAPEMVLRRQLRLMEAQGEIFEKFSKTIQALPTQLGAAQGELNEKFSAGAAALDRSSENMAGQVEAISARLVATLAGFETKIALLPHNFTAAADQSARDLSSAMRESLKNSAQIAEESARAQAQDFSTRFEALAGAFSAAALSISAAAQNARDSVEQGAKSAFASGEQATAQLNGEIAFLAQAIASLSARLDQTERALALHNERLENAGDIVAASSKNLALAAGAMESAAAPLTTATLTFRDAMAHLETAARRIETISQAGETIADQIARFGAQMTGALAAFDALPEKIRRSETAFGADLLRATSALGEASLTMGKTFATQQASMAATLQGFERRIEKLPETLGAAAEQTGRDMSAKIQGTFLGALDSVAAVAQKASSSGADLFAARIDEISRALSSAADRLLQASDASSASLSENRKTLEAGAAQAAQMFDSAAQNSSAAMTHVVERFADSARNLSLKLAETALGLDAQNQRLEKAGATLDVASNSLAEAAGAVASATPPLAAAGVSLERALGSFAQTGAKISQVSALAEKTAENFSQTADQASASLQAQGENFAAVEAAMRATLDRLNGGVQALTQEITQVFEAYDNEIARSIGSLEAALLDMGDILDDRAAKKSGER